MRQTDEKDKPVLPMGRRPWRLTEQYREPTDSMTLGRRGPGSRGPRVPSPPTPPHLNPDHVPETTHELGTAVRTLEASV